MNRRQICSAVISFLVLIVLVSVANAQSKDRDNPTPLTSGEISGLIDSDTKGNVYYYSFTANPGEITVALSVESNPPIDTYASSLKTVSFTLFDRNAEALSAKSVSTSYGAGIGQAVGRVNITRRQTLIIGINIPESVFNSGAGKYRVRISGSVDSSQNNSTPTGKEEVTDYSDAIRNAGKLKRIDCLPKQGTLIIKMKDGSKKIIDLSEAETVTVVP